MFGRQPDGSEEPARMELVRLAIPRRVYTQSHIDYVVECFERLYDRRDTLCGYEITEEPPQLRHFTAHFHPLDLEAVHRETPATTADTEAA
jgi:tryptophanase